MTSQADHPIFPNTDQPARKRITDLEQYALRLNRNLQTSQTSSERKAEELSDKMDDLDETVSRNAAACRAERRALHELREEFEFLRAEVQSVFTRVQGLEQGARGVWREVGR